MMPSLGHWGRSFTYGLIILDFEPSFLADIRLALQLGNPAHIIKIDRVCTP